jgi:hypothetical protein
MFCQTKVPGTNVVSERGHAVGAACASCADPSDEVAAIRSRCHWFAHIGLNVGLLRRHLR